MKKYLRIILIALILILAGTLNTYAATATLTANADKTEVKAGDIVTISLSANCQTGIEGIDSTLEYDETKLELQSLNVDAKFSNMSGIDDSTGKYKLTVISNTTDTLTSETFATLKFKVLDTALADEGLTVKLSEIEIGDSNDEWTTVDDREITLKVVEENLGTDDNNQEGDNNNQEENNNQEGDNNNSVENNNSGTNTPDNTQANKKIDYAGLESYALVIIAIIAIVAVISYKKYKKYKNI